MKTFSCLVVYAVEKRLAQRASGLLSVKPVCYVATSQVWDDDMAIGCGLHKRIALQNGN